MTFGTDLMLWDGTKFCRMTSGNTVIFGKKLADPSKGPGIYIYSSEGKKKKRLEDVCEHKETKQGDITSLVLDTTEYVLITCVECKKMFLLNIESGKYYLSYENNDVSFGSVCKGEPGEIYVLVKRPGNVKQSILTLNCENKRFTQRKFLDTQVSGSSKSATYVPSKSYIVMYEKDSRQMAAVSIKTGGTIWQLDPLVNDVPYEPKCLVTYTRRHDTESYDTIVAADGTEKLVVLSATDGRYRHELGQTKFKDIENIQCVGDFLVILQSRENVVAICFYKMKYEFESSV